jgi:hypothetical protein
MYLANRYTAKAISGWVLLAKYISTSMALRYGNSLPNISSPSSLGLGIFLYV